MPKQNPAKKLVWSFVELNKNQECDKMLEFLKSNPDFVLEKNSYLEGISWNFGKNLKIDASLYDYIERLGIDRTKALMGFLYTPLAHITASLPDKIKNAKPLTLDKWHEVFNKLYKDADFNKDNCAKLIDYYMKLIPEYKTEEVMFDLIEKNTNHKNSLNRFITYSFRQNMPLLIKAMEKNVLDVNARLDYENTMLHHYCFYSDTFNQDFLDFCVEKKCNPNLNNVFSQTPLAMLIDKEKLGLAREFLSTFKDSIDINHKSAGKTYLHQLILLINRLDSYSSYEEKQKQAIDLFEEIFTLEASDAQIRSGAKSRGMSVMSYIDKKISNPGLSQALKAKVLLEKEFKSSIDSELPKKSDKKFKL